jgi:hypothetical protein
MSASAWQTYDDFQEWLGDNHGGLDNLTYKMALFLSSSNADTGTNALFGDLTNEHAAANGYTAGGETLANVTWTETAGTATLDADDEVWTASGGSITARIAAIYASGTVAGRASPLICRCLLDDTPADVTATDGNTLTVAIHANGILTLARA